MSGGTEMDRRQDRWPTRLSIAAAVFTLGVWTTNVLESGVLAPHVCSLARMKFESYLFLARGPALVLPVVGLVVAVVTWRGARSVSSLALAMNLAAGLIVAGAALRWLPLHHLPCLRS